MAPIFLEAPITCEYVAQGCFTQKNRTQPIRNNNMLISSIVIQCGFHRALSIIQELSLNINILLAELLVSRLDALPVRERRSCPVRSQRSVP